MDHLFRDALGCGVVSPETERPPFHVALARDGRQTREHVLVALRDLIAALDRRAPRTNWAEESRIAREAAELKRQARARIAEIEHGG